MSEHLRLEFFPKSPRSKTLTSMSPLVLFIVSMLISPPFCGDNFFTEKRSSHAFYISYFYGFIAYNEGGKGFFRDP